MCYSRYSIYNVKDSVVSIDIILNLSMNLSVNAVRFLGSPLKLRVCLVF